MSENNDTSNDSNNLVIDSVLQSSRLNNIQAVRTGVLRPSVLGPSVLGSALNKSSSSASGDVQDVVKEREKDGLISNPFLKEVAEEEDGTANADDEESNEKTNTSEGTPNDKKINEEEDQDGRADPLNLLRKNGLERANLFAAAKNSIPLVEKSGFVFGQNVHERVVGENINPDSSGKADDNDATATSGEMLFSSVIKSVVKPNDGEGMSNKESEGPKSLNEVAREYEESRAQKRKFEEVETFTGEENEVNIVDINCKLFAFVNSNWEERGRGSLRLNDSKTESCSRVVFRTCGNLRLLLNTKVWAGMVAERSSQKSLRLTAMDNTGKIKIFLAMARPAEINQLHKALEERIDSRKSSHPDESQSTANSSGSKIKNGASKEANNEVDEAASTAEPDHEDSAEPSPKKPFPIVDKDN